MTTGGIAHGTTASTRATPLNRRFSLSSSARPSAARNCSAVTETAQIMPMRKEDQKSAALSSSQRFSRPTKLVSWLRVLRASVKARPMP